MQDQRMLPPEEALAFKPRKKKSSKQKASMPLVKLENASKMQEMQGLPFQMAPKSSSKRALASEIPAASQQPDRSTSDSLGDASAAPGNYYRALRRKYLLLEEDGFKLGKGLKTIEGEVKALEDQKDSLLDELVVLEGLVDPSEITKAGIVT